MIVLDIAFNDLSAGAVLSFKLTFWLENRLRDPVSRHLLHLPLLNGL